ncbi:MAG: hypothetical protein IKY66_05385 [Bacteroidales bacterium]|nr:hypothetical protein [Bacteroidales bacterium]
MYRPSGLFNVPAMILKGQYVKVNGVKTKEFADGEVIFVSAKSYGGTERIINDQVIVEDTIEIETWYRPDITSIDGLRLLDDASEWEIVNHPEDIERRHQWLKFKIRRMVGNV